MQPWSISYKRDIIILIFKILGIKKTSLPPNKDIKSNPASNLIFFITKTIDSIIYYNCQQPCLGEGLESVEEVRPGYVEDEPLVPPDICNLHI